MIVNFRTPELTVQCLQSIAAEIPDELGIRAAVVENGSGDLSGVVIQTAIEDAGWGDWCKLVTSNRNLGFAGGNNLGIRRAWEGDASASRKRAPLVLLLNSDTIVNPGCLSHSVVVMNTTPKIGAMSCRLLNADGSLQVVSRKFMSPLRILIGATGLPWKLPRLFDWAQTEYIDWDMERTSGDPEWIGGAFMLLRTEMLDRIGSTKTSSSTARMWSCASVRNERDGVCTMIQPSPRHTWWSIVRPGGNGRRRARPCGGPVTYSCESAMGELPCGWSVAWMPPQYWFAAQALC